MHIKTSFMSGTFGELCDFYKWAYAVSGFLYPKVISLTFDRLITFIKCGALFYCYLDLLFEFTWGYNMSTNAHTL